jgi:hypothetical protein
MIFIVGLLIGIVMVTAVAILSMLCSFIKIYIPEY